jgi:hypothetical protein
MARRSLKPQLNQIRTWVRQGRTDAWIAHQLQVSAKEIDAFKREHDLVPGGTNGDSNSIGAGLELEPDLRAEDDALVAAELDAEPAEEPEGDEPSEDDDRARPRSRRRGRRGGRRRRGRAGGGRRELEGTFDHGDEGFGLWLDPSVQDDPVYAEHWAGHRPITVEVETDRILIRRAGEAGADEEDDDED